jgi:hypothetical protein
MTQLELEKLIQQEEIRAIKINEIIKNFKVGQQATAIDFWQSTKIQWTCLRITKKMVFLQKQRMSDGYIFPEETRQNHKQWASWLFNEEVKK